MIVIVFFTVLFWAFLIGSPRRGAFRLGQAVGTFVAQILAGWGVYWILARYLHLKTVMLLAGFIILVSGFRWLGILNHDFFSPFKSLTFAGFGRISESYAVYFSGLAAMAQLSAAGIAVQGLFWIVIMNIFLAGFLLLLSSGSAWFENHKRILALLRVECGLYLTILGLIIMGGDVPFFINEIEKILHI